MSIEQKLGFENNSSRESNTPENNYLREKVGVQKFIFGENFILGYGRINSNTEELNQYKQLDDTLYRNVEKLIQLGNNKNEILDNVSKYVTFFNEKINDLGFILRNNFGDKFYNRDDGDNTLNFVLGLYDNEKYSWYELDSKGRILVEKDSSKSGFESFDKLGIGKKKDNFNQSSGFEIVLEYSKENNNEN